MLKFFGKLSDLLSHPSLVNSTRIIQHYLDHCDHSFCYHKFFIFVALNIFQRRTTHLHTAFTVKREQFPEVAKRITSLASEQLQNLANCSEQEKDMQNLSMPEKNVFELLKHVNTISSHISGSEASKLSARNCIHSYFGDRKSVV